MKQLLLICAVVALVGCHAGNKKMAEEAKLAAKAIAEARAVAETKTKAEAGDATAQYNLGVMYDDGQGVEQDFKEAVKWYRLAADQGLANAQHNLGVMHATGQGVNPDYVVAYAWCDIAATNELKNAIEAKPIVAKEMTATKLLKPRHWLQR
jgi:TPR repeat protein